jgi:lipoprotein-releasing system ATP-binding protein
VAIARALTLEPKLLLADEPTGNLDTATSDAIHDLFFEINRKHNTTIVVVTHNPSFAQRMPRVVEMSDGKVLRDVRGTLSLDRRED